jgi:hypothetical protein
VIDLTIKLNKDGTEGGKAKAAKPARNSGIKRLPSKRRRISDKGWRFYDPFYYRPTLDAPFDYPPDFYKVSQFVAGDTPCDAHFEFPGNYADYLAYLNNFSKQFTKSNANHWYEITPNHPAVFATAYLTDTYSGRPLTDIAEYRAADGWVFDPASADLIYYLFFGFQADSYPNAVPFGYTFAQGYRETTNEVVQFDFTKSGICLLQADFRPMAGFLNIFEPGVSHEIIYSPIYPCFPRRAVLDSSVPQYGMTYKQVFDTMPGAALYEKIVFTDTGECTGGFLDLSATDYEPLLSLPTDVITGVIIQNGTRFFTDAPRP